MGKSDGGRGKKRDGENGEIPRVTKTCKVVLISNDGLRIPVGDIKLTEPEPGPTIEQFADEAYKSARASLARLMTPQYRLVVIDGQREQGYGLDRWIKLHDGSIDDTERTRKQSIRKKATA